MFPTQDARPTGLGLPRAVSTKPAEDGEARRVASFQTAYDETAAERAALEPADLVPVNLDVLATVERVLGALPALKLLRQDIVDSLGGLDLTTFDKLGTYARALAHAQGLYLARSEPAPTLPALAARARELREALLSDARVLARRALLDEECLARLSGRTGYVDIAFDLGALVRIFRSAWKSISSRTAVEERELAEAERLFERIVLSCAARKELPGRVVAAAEERRRAFTLLVRAYEETRRVVAFLRWHVGDADAIAPSLWAGRGGRGRRVSDAAVSRARHVSEASGEAAVVPVPGEVVDRGKMPPRRGARLRKRPRRRLRRHALRGVRRAVMWRPVTATAAEPPGRTEGTDGETHGDGAEIATSRGACVPLAKARP